MRNFFVNGAPVLAGHVSKEYPEIYIQNEVTIAQNQFVLLNKLYSEKLHAR